jgi:transposase-like protein
LTERETYEQIRERHEREMREWVEKAMEGGGAVNAMAKRHSINPGTMWRLVRRYRQEVAE